VCLQHVVDAPGLAASRVEAIGRTLVARARPVRRSRFWRATLVGAVLLIAGTAAAVVRMREEAALRVWALGARVAAADAAKAGWSSPVVGSADEGAPVVVGPAVAADVPDVAPASAPRAPRGHQAPRASPAQPSLAPVAQAA